MCKKQENLEPASMVYFDKNTVIRRNGTTFSSFTVPGFTTHEQARMEKWFLFLIFFRGFATAFSMTAPHLVQSIQCICITRFQTKCRWGMTPVHRYSNLRHCFSVTNLSDKMKPGFQEPLLHFWKRSWQEHILLSPSLSRQPYQQHSYLA